MPANESVRLLRDAERLLGNALHSLHSAIHILAANPSTSAAASDALYLARLIDDAEGEACSLAERIPLEAVLGEEIS